MGAQPEDPEEQGDYPSAYFTLTKYTYNENSQVLNHLLNGNTISHKYTYNNRNWLTRFNIDPTGNAIFLYDMQYDSNGNIRRAVYGGSYKDGFGTTPPNLYFKYIYDNSNRLVKTQNESGNNSFNIINGYDKDGNFVGMKRYGSSNNLADDFGYSYFSGTNRLNFISVGDNSIHYTYDNNGNMTSDEMNKNSAIKYDHRNLMIENLNTLSQFTFKTYYRYDEAGNRISKKQYIYVNGKTPEEGDLPEGHSADTIITDDGDGNGYWAMTENTYYVRDISGKEIAIYSGNTLDFWNIWGLDNVGKINADTTRNYYLKDHLGSIRVMLNSTNGVVSAQDYDAWGYLLENRSYQPEDSKYKFTNKERDKDLQNNYDYFGARYYDSRIANWTSIDPLFEKHYSYSPYNYVLRSPLILVDPDGKQTNLHTYQLSDENLSTSSDYRAIGESYEDEAVRKGRKNPFIPQPGILEAEVIDPVDLLTGMAMAKLSFKLTSKFVFKEGVETLGKTITKDVATETIEQSTKLSSKLVREAYEKSVEFLGENYTKIVNDAGDYTFMSKTGKIRFDFNNYLHHGKTAPHIHIQVPSEILKNGKTAWKNFETILFKK